MAEITSIYSKMYRDGEAYGSFVEPNGSILLAGYAWGNMNYVACIKFTLPKPAKSLLFRFCNDTGGMSVVQHLRYKITTSEDASLINATSATAGDGSFTMPYQDFSEGTLEIDRTMTAGTYYLYIWTDDSSVRSNVMRVRWYPSSNPYGFTASYEELESCVYIFNGTDWEPHQIYIFNGAIWELYEAYIHNGTSWELYG